MIFLEEGVIAAVVSLHRRRMRGSGFVDHGGNQKSGNQSAIRVGGNDAWLDDFFGDDNYFAGGADGVNGDAEAAPEMRVACGVGALDLQDGDVGTQSADSDESFFADRRGKFAEVAIFLEQVAAESGVGGHEWDAHGSGMQGEGDGEIGVVDDFKAAWEIAFDGAAEAVADSGGDVADPGRHHSRDAAGADQLIEKNVGNGADESEVTAALANDFVAGSERNHLLELRAHEDHRAGGHVLGDSFAHRE